MQKENITLLWQYQQMVCKKPLSMPSEDLGQSWRLIITDSGQRWIPITTDLQYEYGNFIMIAALLISALLYFVIYKQC